MAPASPSFLTALFACHIPSLTSLHPQALTAHLSAPPFLSPITYPCPSPLPSLTSPSFMSSSFTDGQLTPPKKDHGWECRIHFFIAGKTISRANATQTPQWGWGYPHAGGEWAETGLQQAWPGMVPRPKDTQAGQANSQGRLCPACCRTS